MSIQLKPCRHILYAIKIFKIIAYAPGSHIKPLFLKFPLPIYVKRKHRNSISETPSDKNISGKRTEYRSKAIKHTGKEQG